ncbi:hypothetical protein Hanom_Chr16g01505711 [Helianthus anomalus]
MVSCYRYGSHVYFKVDVICELDYRFIVIVYCCCFTILPLLFGLATRNIFVRIMDKIHPLNL